MREDHHMAPAAVFVYARADHTKRTLAALAQNEGASGTDVIVFADGARGEHDAERVADTRSVVREAKGFRSITLIERPDNLGLAENIIQGVTEVTRAYGRVIVLEDDIVTAPNFLPFMNTALREFRDNQSVWHISGWNAPISPDGLPEAFFYRVMSCWGWATWTDRWQHYHRDPSGLLNEFTAEEKYAFNLDGAHDFFSQIEKNASGDLKTWAVFWYATIFKRGGLCLNPTLSLVQNIGFDGSGENCGLDYVEPLPSAARLVPALPTDVIENDEAVTRIRSYYQPTFYKRVIRQLRRLSIAST